MRLFIDIGHPAHVHYFKQLIWDLEQSGNQVFVSARNKECVIDLLESYKIKYFNRGAGATSPLGKLFNLIRTDYILYKQARDFNPDLFLSFASPYAGQVARMLNKPHIAFDDTEHAKFGQFFYVPFANYIFTPNSFHKSYGPKHFKFNGFMELSYLQVFIDARRTSFGDKIINSHRKRVLIRFVAWTANHDVGQKGLSNESKVKIVEELSKNFDVIISSETALPENLIKYQAKIQPDKIHELIDSVELYIGEGATMASEAALLGVPAIYINTLSAGTINAQQDAGLLFHFSSDNGLIEKALTILAEDKTKYIKLADNLLHDKINLSEFMIWLVKNYPTSISKLESQNVLRAEEGVKL